MASSALRRLPYLPLWITPILAIVASLDAQQQDSARITGTARSSVNGLPLSGVMIAVAGSRAFDVTDSTGAFALSGLPGGKQTVRILYRDDVLHEQDFTLKRGKTLQLDVLLDVNAIELAPIVVAARSPRTRSSLVGFYERRQRGFGRYYTFEELERRGALPVRALLIESGVDVRCRMGDCVPVIRRGGRLCVATVYVDGWMGTSHDVMGTSHDVEFWRADDLAGVEIYKSEFSVPWDFRLGFGRDCGAVMLWTRY